MDIPELKNPLTKGRIISTDTDPAVYHRTAGGERGGREFIMSSSGLRDFVACARKWRLGGEPEKETDATEWGIILDGWVLSPDRFVERFVITPKTYLDTKTGEPKPWTFAANFCKSWKEKQGSKIIVKAADFAEAKMAVARLFEDDQISHIISNSLHQLMVLAEYHDQDSGITVPVKGLIDGVPDDKIPVFGNSLWDLKTIRDAGMRAWKSDVFYRRYYIQAAFYLWLYNAAANETRDSFFHILSENVPPYETGRRILTQEFLDMGRRFVLAALRYYCQCLSSNTWPDYDAGLVGYRGWSFTAPEPWMLMVESSFPEPNPQPKSESASSELAS